jgi:hypothetical protein
MKNKLKYSKGEIVNFAGRMYKITDYKRCGFTGIEYNLEALKPDKKTGFFERCYGIPEGFITKDNIH